MEGSGVGRSATSFPFVKNYFSSIGLIAVATKSFQAARIPVDCSTEQPDLSQFAENYNRPRCRSGCHRRRFRRR